MTLGHKLLKLKKYFKPLIVRTLAFMACFVVLSGIIGPVIIRNGLVGSDGFQIYGGAGKAFLFGAIALSLLISRKGIDIELKPWRWHYIGWLVCSGLALGLALYGVEQLSTEGSSALWALPVHTGILASVVLAAGGTFGPANLRKIGQTYKKELLLTLGLSVGFFVFVYIIYGLWTVLAAAVLHAVRWLLTLSGLFVTLVPPRTLLLDKFGIQVAQYCSGIESIALFTALYALIGVLDWQRFVRRRFLLIFPIALVILFSLNILRVFGLIMAGYYINPEIAFSLFHTYAGMIFFIFYSGIFWAVAYKWMLKKTSK